MNENEIVNPDNCNNVLLPNIVVDTLFPWGTDYVNESSGLGWSLECDTGENNPDLKCFAESYHNCKHVRVRQTEYTDEGDYMTTLATVQEGGAGNCVIHAIYESNDRFRFSGLRESICHNIKEEQSSLIIDQCENKDYSFVFYKRK